jgi:hypothetical protein
MSIQISRKKIAQIIENKDLNLLDYFIESYLNAIEGTFNEKNMQLLNGTQHSVLAYHFFRTEVMHGGFIQLIQNGFGGYIFKNPFAKSLKLFGLNDLAKIIYKAKEIYDENEADLEKETTDEAFHAMYEQYEAFDELEELFFEMEADCSKMLSGYIESHLEEFAEIID